jgi:predicted RNase H-like HicB family nuclease
MSRPIVIHADWDPEAAVWVATTQDLRGLVTEAESIEALRAKLSGMILDLLEENEISDVPASIEIIARPAHHCQLSDTQVAEVELTKREVREDKIASDAEMGVVWRRFGP